MTIDIVGNKDGIYICPSTCNAFVNPCDAINYAEVDFDDVNHLVILRGNDESMKIIQASGYSCDKGMFINMY